MSAAKGPPCVVCGRRVSRRAIPRCPWCGAVVCYACTCPRFEVHQPTPCADDARKEPGP